MENKTKEVYFAFCTTCIHKDKSEHEEPCNECLQVFYRPDSHKPIYYESEEQNNG